MPVTDHYPSPGVITEMQVLPNLPSTGPAVPPWLRGFFLVHHGLPGKAALIFRKKYSLSR